MTILFLLEKKMCKTFCNKLDIFLFEGIYKIYQLSRNNLENYQKNLKDHLDSENKYDKECKRIMNKNLTNMLKTLLKLNYIIYNMSLDNVSKFDTLNVSDFIEKCYKECFKNLYYCYDLFKNHNFKNIFSIIDKSIYNIIFETTHVNLNYNENHLKKIIENESDFLLSKYLNIVNYDEN